MFKLAETMSKAFINKVNFLKTWKETSPLERGVLGLSLLYFVVKSLYFATVIGADIYPDETTWFGLCEVFSHSWGLPKDSPESFQYGPVTHVPVLYYFLMGKALWLNVFSVSNLVFLRCVNAIFGLFTVWFGWKTIRLMTTNLPARLLFIVFMTNTLMFTFISGSVSYDNLTNLFCALLVYHMSAYFKERQADHILWFLIFAALGGLTKTSFLPLAALALVPLLIHERSRILLLPGAIKEILFRPTAKPAILLVSFLVIAGMNGMLHLGNLIKFKTLEPSPDKFMRLEDALQYRIFARGYILGQFSQQKIWYEEAVRMASLIKHEGDRQATIFLLKKRLVEQEKPTPPQRMSRLAYVRPWTELMLGKIFGIMGHKSMEKVGTGLIPYYSILAGGLLFMLVLMPFSRGLESGWHLLLLFVGYLVILMQIVNYPNYFNTGVIVLALQGRYLFPVLIPLYILVTTSLMRGLKIPVLQWATLAIAAGIFLYGEFPWFLRHVTSAWFFS